jgi:hypothetical protein
MAEQEHAQDADSEEMEGFIEARPLTALAIAVVLGALIGRRLLRSGREAVASK